jgi:hypothetical protein
MTDGGHYAAAASRLHDRLLRAIWQAPPPPQKRERQGLHPQAFIRKIGGRRSTENNGSDATAQARGGAR